MPLEGRQRRSERSCRRARPPSSGREAAQSGRLGGLLLPLATAPLTTLGLGLARPPPLLAAGPAGNPTGTKSGTKMVAML